MIQIAICDDEPYMIDLLNQKISAFFHKENIEISICCFSNGIDLLSSNKTFHIIFLDVQMDKADGFEIAKKLRNNEFDGFLIFVTIMREAVFSAFEVQAFDYLIKPLQEKHFNQTMQRLLSSLQNQNRKCLMVQKKNEWNIILFNHIMYCEIINRKVYLHLKDKSIIDYYDKIENLEKKLDSRFFKCHRSYLINLQYVKNYKSTFAYLTNGEAIPVSRLRKEDFSMALLHYIKQQHAPIKPQHKIIES